MTGTPKSAKGVFPAFTKVFAREMEAEYPFFRRMEQTLCPRLPKSSTFYLGAAKTKPLHVLVNLQPAQKAWEVGQFTLNIHLSAHLEPTANWTGLSKQWEQLEPGFYRLGSVARGRDKWWCLLPPFSPLTGKPFVSDDWSEYWAASSYDSADHVIREAVADVRRDLEACLYPKLGLTVRRSGP